MKKNLEKFYSKGKLQMQPGYVYFLKHKFEPRFKIGSTNSIETRINQLGGITVHDVDSSYIMDFETRELAYNYEKAIQKIFNEWKIEPVQEKREAGDTELFDIKCFNMACAFVIEKAELLRKTTLKKIEIKKREKAKTKARKTTNNTQPHRLGDVNKSVILTVSKLIDYRDQKLLKIGFLSADLSDEINVFVLSENSDSQIRGFLMNDLSNLVFPYAFGRFASVFSDCSQNVSKGGVAISIYKLSKKFCKHINKNRTLSNGEQLNSSNELSFLDLLDEIKENDVFEFIRQAGFVEKIDKYTDSDIREGVVNIFSYKLTNYFVADGESSLAYWIMRYLVLLLLSNGKSQDEICGLLKDCTEISKTKVSKMKKEVNPFDGRVHYKNPVTLGYSVISDE